jgi:spore germination protein YaaH
VEQQADADQTTVEAAASDGEEMIGGEILRHEVWYDDPRSLQLKVAMAKELGIRRFGCWTADALDCRDHPEAAHAMWDALQ